MEDTITGGTYTDNKFTETKEINDSFSKRVEKYLRLSHKTLAEMLALRDEEENKFNPNDGGLQPNQPYYPYIPYIPPYIHTYKLCPLSLRECTNSFSDCINCPYHGGVTYETTCTNTTADLKPNVNSYNSDFIEKK
jgi:hypothetical protein